MDARTLHIDPAEYKINRRLFARIWRLLTPYWTVKKHWPNALVLVWIFAMTPVVSIFNYHMAQYTADMTNAIVGKQEDLYRHLFWLTTGLGMAQWIYSGGMTYLNNWVQLHWRQWLTDWVVVRYLKNRTYYDITLKEDLDNPDQRITGDVLPVIGTMAGIPERVLSQVMALITGGFIIAGVSANMMWWVIIYTAVSTLFTLLAYTPLIRKSFNVTMAEADLRYGLLHVRDNAETVAFYRGEDTEHAQIKGRLSRAVVAAKKVMTFNFAVGFVNQAMQIIWQMSPFFLIAPLFFQGKIEYGAIAMATMAAGQMMQSLKGLAEYIPTIASMAPSAVRLAQVVERFDQMEAAQACSGAHEFKRVTGSHIVLSNVSLQTPGAEQNLVENISLEVALDSSLVIIGQTGVGKSSMLRAMAGLWRRGQGTITMPAHNECMFLPQRPYMILANLRSQLLYPRGTREVSDAELQEVLVRVCLPDLIKRNGGLDAVRDWGKVLSLGEQQRVAFARILISQIKFVFLDEATSAVDIPTEAALYRLLKEESIGYVSVGHRETILPFHTKALCLHPGGSWELSTPKVLFGHSGILPSSPSLHTVNGNQ